MTIVIGLFIICIFTIFVLSALASDDGPGSNSNSDSNSDSDSPDPFDGDWEAPELELIVQERARRANEIGLGSQRTDRRNNRQNSFPSNEGLWGDGT